MDRNHTRTIKATPDQTTDKAMTVLRATSGNRVIGTILQYAAHPVILGDDNRDVHSDFVLSALVKLEQGGGTALYYNGPIADTSPSGVGSANCSEVNTDYCGARNYGRALANDALNILGSNGVEVEPTLESRAANVVLPVTNPIFLVAGGARMFNGYYNFVETPVDSVPEVAMVRNELPQVAPFATTTVSRVTLGNPANGKGLEIATIPGEGRNSLGQLIRLLARNANGGGPVTTMLLGLTHNSFGYIIPEQEFGGTVAGLPDDLLYEEIVSLGPLTAPMLRLQGYFPLFDAPPAAYAPEYLTACQATPDSNECMLQILQYRLGVSESPLDSVLETVSDGLKTIAEGCHDMAGPLEPICVIPDTLAGLLDDGMPPGGGAPSNDSVLLHAAADALARGCDMLDTAHCLLPFPSDHFTVAASPDSPQSVNKDGTGRRINFNALAMPRNVAGKPIDPTEWNRNDGYSPGQQIITYVPNLGTIKDSQGNPTGPIVGAPPLTDLSRSLSSNASVMVLEVPRTPEPSTPRQHLIWAEIDLNAGFLLPADRIENPDPTKEKRPALIIRPAVNFNEGRRYVVVLRNLKDNNGNDIAAQAPFAACRDKVVSGLPSVQQRCLALDDPNRADDVFDILAAAGVTRGPSLYLAWDFTVASTENNVARLRHMRDDAFVSYLGQTENPDGSIATLGNTPAYKVTRSSNRLTSARCVAASPCRATLCR